MARETRQDLLAATPAVNAPEVNLARRVLERYNLIPPIDVLDLATKYADVDVIPFPVNLDGVCLNLKISGKRPAIVLNQNRPPRRRRFTLAHEIGHVLIPWHVGNIVDEIDVPQDGTDLSYWELEGEANRFAAELLMPRAWIETLIRSHDDPSEGLGIIADTAEVSIDAAIIQIIKSMPSGYVYAFLDDDGTVMASGRSEGTLVARPVRGEFLDVNIAFPASEKRWYRTVRGTACYWWRFPSRMELPAQSDALQWRDILNEILADLSIDGEAATRIKQSLSGIIGVINGDVRRRKSGLDRNTLGEILYAACMQRFDLRLSDDPLLHEVVLHEDFPAYLAGRIRDLSSR